MTHADIISVIEAYASPTLQESWDNTGWQVTPSGTTDLCTGVITCLDITPAVVDEARAKGCNLIISHHPLIFRGLRSITGAGNAEQAVISAIRSGIAIYSSHTALDSTPGGVSHELGSRLGLTDMRPLSPSSVSPDAGLGVIGTISGGITRAAFIETVKRAYDAPTVRVTQGPRETGDIHTVALCSGSGGEFITTAITLRADAYITSDVRYHDFLDHGQKIIIIDTGHFESEICTKSIFSRIISQKFPNFAVHMATCEQNPVAYI
ncbi:Nif3-like dinuclear metal center hexameric protein [Muribaculaceae bacterium Isolate-110 (HZI)]|nr:Nif3-like dinuclear metal center hexameric protein [Muribaculaceae bacterium Isolate-110 (HZI)]